VNGARWQVIVDAITAGIRSGTYQPGARIPSVAELMATHGVSRGTVTRAVDVLKARGVVRGDQGVGTIVIDTTAIPTVTGVEADVQALEARVAALEAIVIGISEQLDIRDGGDRNGRRRRPAGASGA
jgi:DNA-binding GntR family transcriptional regulator